MHTGVIIRGTRSIYDGHLFVRVVLHVGPLMHVVQRFTPCYVGSLAGHERRASGSLDRVALISGG